ncbi:MAG: hypothetical protein IH830_12180 [Planctomycetes bacterium]|nr:hypothetical protein [Planctomycetota bacterium]
MNRSASFTTMCAAVCLFVPGGTATAGVLEFEDKDEWLDAIGPFVTVDFTGFEPGTVITDQYADLGVLFVDGFYTIKPFDPFLFPNDGWGLDGNGNITVAFDTPMAYIGVDYPGFLRIELFRDGKLIYTSSVFFGDPVGNFAGLLSTKLFDMAVLMDDPPPDQAAIDDLHFGPPDCAPDLDGDGSVGILDLLALLAAWGTDPGGPPDFDGDGTVGILDLLALLAAWGECP